ncbi:MAG TPA: DUF1963 domain-containing protein [Candidatus Acidoferrum sp.]|nr:DUF1963 domain-containing protein [Candidatus Acidoferrum sp.]
MTPAEFLKLAAEYKLEHIGQALLSTSVSGIRALDGAMRDANSGDRTFIGGMPSPMPPQWPSHKETPLTFVAQTDTETLPAGISPVPLPPGVLQFFVPSTGEANDYEPSLDAGRVLFVPAGDVLSEDSGEPLLREGAGQPGREASLVSRIVGLFGVVPRGQSAAALEHPHRVFPKRGFDWEVFPTLYASAPDAESLWLPDSAQHFEFNHEADWDSYFEFRRVVMACPRWNWLVQMFGFANEQQEDMQPLVDVASGRRSLNEFKDWLMLFALNSACKGLAPEAVCYYFWIHRDDLASGNFDEVWLCTQQD